MSRKNKKGRMMVQVQVDEKRRKTPKKRAPKKQNTVPKVKTENSGVVVNVTEFESSAYVTSL